MLRVTDKEIKRDRELNTYERQDSEVKERIEEQDTRNNDGV